MLKLFYRKLSKQNTITETYTKKTYGVVHTKLNKVHLGKPTIISRNFVHVVLICRRLWAFVLWFWPIGSFVMCRRDAFLLHITNYFIVKRKLNNNNDDCCRMCLLRYYYTATVPTLQLKDLSEPTTTVLGKRK